MLSKALREYDTVSVEPSTDGRGAVLFEKGASRAGIDVRRFPWIRPLSGDYAYNFDRVASLYAGDPTRPEAWSDVIGRVQAQKRDRREIVDVLAAQQARRNAPPEARAAARAARGPQGRRHRDRAAGRGVRRPALHAAEGGHRHPARAAYRQRTPRARRPDLLGRCRGSRLGGDRGTVRCSTRRSSRAPSRWRPPREPATFRSRD